MPRVRRHWAVGGGSRVVGPPSGRTQSTRHRRGAGSRRVVHAEIRRPPAAGVRRVDMFEPLGETPIEKQTSGRTMKIIGIAMAVIAVVLAVVSFS